MSYFLTHNIGISMRRLQAKLSWYFFFDSFDFYFLRFYLFVLESSGQIFIFIVSINKDFSHSESSAALNTCKISKISDIFVFCVDASRICSKRFFSLQLWASYQEKSSNTKAEFSPVNYDSALEKSPKFPSLTSFDLSSKTVDNWN